MKKLFSSLFALSALLLANTSCSQDEWNDNGAEGNEVEVTFTTQLENAAATRAVIGDGTKAKHLYFSVYKADAETEIEAMRQDKVPVNDDLTATITTRLVKGQTYNFVFWAQNEDGAKYYNIDDRKTIQVKYDNMMANDENRDAFLAVRKDLLVNGPINGPITLKRPFAQVNVGTAIGSLADAAKAGTEIAKSAITLDNVANTLNAFTGEATGETQVTFVRAALPESNAADKEGDLKNVAGENYEYLSMNYILVNDETETGTERALLDATFEIFDPAGTTINKFEIPNVRVQRNWRTNIIGDILNSNVTFFNIIIDPEFDGDHNYPTELEEKLAFAAANGGEVTLTKDITLDGALNVKGSMILNLDNYTLSAKKDVDVIIIDEGGKLTINGNSEGEVAAVNGAGFPIICKGELIINSGNFSTGKDDKNLENGGIYATGNGKITINGGHFYNSASDMVDVLEGQALRYLLNKSDSYRNTTDIVVKGGTFVNFNPADNASEGTGTDYVAEGYNSILNNGTYYVVPEEVDAVATTAAELN